MNRYEFLKISAAMAGTSLMASLPGISNAFNPANAKRPLIKKSLKYGMIKEDLSITDKFKLIKDLGFHGVELDSPNELDRKEVLKARDASGIELPGVVNSLHWRMPLSHPDADTRQKCIDSMRTSLYECRDYGGNTVLLVPGVVNENIPYDEAWERSTASIKKIIPWAHETGVKIAIENVWNNFLLSPLEAARFVDQFNDPMVGWYFDIGNILRYGWPEHWIRILGSRILKLDIKEFSRKKQNEEGLWKGFDVEFLEGDIDWKEVMQALTDIDYQGRWMSAEVGGGDRQRLQVISERMDRILKS